MAGAGRLSSLLAVVEMRYTWLVSMLTSVVLDWLSIKRNYAQMSRLLDS
jgi:hypothetical protein